ncbi:MAG: prepilin-type N-terminal cleavage/methylation domain-containing protein [Candidatus Saccharimonadales bacterium]
MGKISTLTGKTRHPRSSGNGFTIVELLIVIVIIGILAAITIVAYNGIQNRARDAQRKSDLSQIAKALQMYKLDNGSYPSISSGCASGSSGNGNGYFNSVYGGTTKSIGRCLVDDGKLTAELKDPSGSLSCSGTTCHTYMFYVCAAGAFIMANLDSVPHDGTGSDGTCTSTWDTDYGINYFVKVS